MEVVLFPVFLPVWPILQPIPVPVLLVFPPTQPLLLLVPYIVIVVLISVDVAAVVTAVPSGVFAGAPTVAPLSDVVAGVSLCFFPHVTAGAGTLPSPCPG